MPRSRKSSAANKTTASSSRSTSSAATVEAVVLLDSYRWHETSNDPSTPLHEADKGDTIKVSQAEYDRAQDMVPRGLAKASENDPLTASDTPEIPKDLSELSDKELLVLATQLRLNVDADATRDALVGAIAASPGGNERPNQ